MRTVIIILLLALCGCVNVKRQSFDKLVSVLDDTYPVWKINGSLVNTNGAVSVFFSETRPDEIVIPNWQKVLNGSSHGLLACHGDILAEGNLGYVVGTSIEGPTHGKLQIYDPQWRLVGSADCQKVVKMKLVDLLNDGVKEIVTWEDHHYGTCTTRRVLNIYKVLADGQVQKVFEHDVVDARRSGWDISEGQPKPITNDVHYVVDFDARRAEKRIVVTAETGVTKTFAWKGTCYTEETLPTTGRTVPPEAGASGVQ